MVQIAPTDPGMRKIMLPSIIRISDVFQVNSSKAKSNNLHRKNRTPRYILKSGHAQLMLEL